MKMPIYQEDKLQRGQRVLGVNIYHDNESSAETETPYVSRKENIADENEEFNNQLALAKKQIESQLEEKYALLYKTKTDEISERERLANENINKAVELVHDVKKSYREKLADDMKGLNHIVVMLTMEALFKLVGDAEHYKALVEKNISESIDLLSDGIKIKGRISHDDYELLSSSSSFDKVRDIVHVDMVLKRGQFHLDDTLSSYEAGILDRLDSLRSAFLDALEKNHES